VGCLGGRETRCTPGVRGSSSQAPLLRASVHLPPPSQGGHLAGGLWMGGSPGPSLSFLCPQGMRGLEGPAGLPGPPGPRVGTAAQNPLALTRIPEASWTWLDTLGRRD
jgi:hypothetical protein